MNEERFFLEKLGKSLKTFDFLLTFFQILKIFKIWKIRGWCSLVEKVILHLLLTINRLYPYNGLRDSIFRRPLFLTNTGKRDATISRYDAIFGRPVTANKFSFERDVSDRSSGGYWKFGDGPFVTSETSRKNDGGQK